MKIAIAGCGGIANIHAQIIKEMGYDIHLCIGRTKESTEAFQKKWNIKKSSCDFQSIFQEKIDIIHICTPPGLHYEMAKECLNNNINVICEKPLCLKDEEADELSKLVNEKGLINAVGFNVRYHTAINKMKQSIGNGELGDIFLIHGYYAQEFHILPVPYGFRYDEKLAGKMRAVTEIGSHFFDLVFYLTSMKVKSISSRFKNVKPVRYLSNDGMMYSEARPGSKEIIIDSEDIAIVNFELENKAIGNVVLSEVSHGKINRLSIEITGESSSLYWNSEENNFIHSARKGDGIKTEILGFDGGFVDSFRQLYKNVYSGNNTEYPNFEDGAYAVKICNAIYKSALSNGIYVEIN